MEKYIFEDKIAKILIRDLKRADILDFRSRLLENGVGIRTVNITISILKIVCKEAYFREEIDRNPTEGIGLIKGDEKRYGIFTVKELKALFAEMPGVFENIHAYTAFLLAAHAGLRRSEVLALLSLQRYFAPRINL